MLAAQFDLGSFIAGAVVGAAAVGLFVFFIWAQRSNRLRRYQSNPLGPLESPFERSTDRVRNVMRLANEYARSCNHEYIGTEHILLGLAEDGAGVAANVLKKFNIDLQTIRREIAKILQFGPSGNTASVGKLPFTPWAKKVIEYSIEEARNLKHNYVGTEHLLLGLLREEEAVAAQVLVNLGLKLVDVRSETHKLLGSSNGDSGVKR